jgi:hypothetical protein
MPRTSLLPSVAVVVGLALGLTGCGDDTKVEKDTTETTVKATTTTEADVAETTEPETETTEADPTGDGTNTDFADIDLGDELEPIEGFTYETLPDAARSALLDTFSQSAEVKDLVAAVGTTVVTDDSGRSLLIFLGLNRELSDAEAEELVGGITSGGTDLEQGEVAGQTGWAYVSADGTQGFVTIRKDTVIIGQSDSTDHLAAVIQGLFTANPEL